MRIVLQIISFLGLALLFLATIAYLFGNIDRELLKRAMLVGTIAWFGTCPFWIGKESGQA